ncbi:hypothetical protein D3C72_1060940 [compost metagenome]
MLMVMMFCSPPYSASASASAVSVLPTPEVPQSMKTPMGFCGLSSRAREVWMRRAIISRPCFWPMTRWFSVSASLSTASTSFLTMRPTGMPVQSATTEATACSSTEGRMSGDSPCTAWILACSSCSSASSVARSGPASAGSAAASPFAGASTGLLPARSLLRSSSRRSTSPFSSCQRAFNASSCTFDSASSVATSAARLVTSMPMASSRPMISCSTVRPSMRRMQSSTSGGVACCDTATRAQAVSSRLTALSGNWRAGM